MPRRARVFEDDEMYLFFGTGTATTANGEPERGRLVATLWLPDPEARRGWSVHPVHAEPEGPATATRRLGFRSERG